MWLATQMSELQRELLNHMVDGIPYDAKTQCKWKGDYKILLSTPGESNAQKILRTAGFWYVLTMAVAFLTANN